LIPNSLNSNRLWTNRVFLHYAGDGPSRFYLELIENDRLDSNNLPDNWMGEINMDKK